MSRDKVVDVMPWDAASFKARHNKKLSPGKSAKAASIANAILRRTGDEGLAIATANARAKGQKPKKQSFGSLSP